ncbi:hypothetical protein VNO78_20681 [Psophocarpus tetragonolobus]|uniref:Uncharacterized protein n=1 Tax=Psophocarpus tetragonolobus TaxID=3891 RepID=A0AAN9SBE2_PSOTE
MASYTGHVRLIHQIPASKATWLVTIFGEEIRELYCSLSNLLLYLRFFLHVFLLICSTLVYFVNVIVRLVILMGFSYPMMCRAYILLLQS